MKKIVYVILAIAFVHAFLLKKTEQPQYQSQPNDLEQITNNETPISRDAASKKLFLPTNDTEKYEGDVANATKISNVASEATQITSQEDLVAEKKGGAKSLEQLALEKKEVPIEDELKRSMPFDTWRPDEISATGQYRGQITFGGNPYIIRLDLMFDGGNYQVRPGSCFSMFTSDKILIKEFFSDGKITLMRMPEQGYLIISIEDKYYLQIFETRVANKRSFVTYFRLKGKRGLSSIFRLNDISDGVPNGCE